MTAPGAERAHWSRLCPSDRLVEGGDGLRFTVAAAGGPEPAFVVRVRGVPRAYLNRCAHVPVELDWLPGRFLDDTGVAVVCSVHGALYDARDGGCLGGPCDGEGLVPIDCDEAHGWVRVQARCIEPPPLHLPADRKEAHE